jgi:hypothetical protein
MGKMRLQGQTFAASGSYHRLDRIVCSFLHSRYLRPVCELAFVLDFSGLQFWRELPGRTAAGQLSILSLLERTHAVHSTSKKMTLLLALELNPVMGQVSL